MEVFIVAFFVTIVVIWILTWLATPKVFRARVRRVEAGKCAHCEYDLHGLEKQAKCPECGGVQPISTQARAAIKKILILIFGSVGVAACLGIAAVLVPKHVDATFQNTTYMIALQCVLLFPAALFSFVAFHTRQVEHADINTVCIANWMGAGLGTSIACLFSGDEYLIALIVAIFVPVLSGLSALLAAMYCRAWKSG